MKQDTSKYKKKYPVKLKKYQENILMTKLETSDLDLT